MNINTSPQAMNSHDVQGGLSIIYFWKIESSVGGRKLITIFVSFKVYASREPSLEIKRAFDSEPAEENGLWRWSSGVVRKNRNHKVTDLASPLWSAEALHLSRQTGGVRRRFSVKTCDGDGQSCIVCAGRLATWIHGGELLLPPRRRTFAAAAPKTCFSSGEATLPRRSCCLLVPS